jgi:magnesium-transporting ATPase (P-type)
MQSVNNREEELARVNEEMEWNLDLVGSTAIEDKLQAKVPETIRYMRQAGLRVWVLTGDKIETAINIGHSSGLLDNQMTQAMILSNLEGSIHNEIKEGLKLVLKREENKLSEKIAVIVGGESLLYIFKNDELKADFLELSCKADVVLACRVSPK